MDRSLAVSLVTSSRLARWWKNLVSAQYRSSGGRGGQDHATCWLAGPPLDRMYDCLPCPGRGQTVALSHQWLVPRVDQPNGGPLA